ncbi:MAG: PEP-CTERM sorting domain-containing protein [Tepidisphaeraceae bacterium]
MNPPSTFKFACGAFLAVGGLVRFADAGVIYDNIPDPLPGNVVSYAYEADSVAEFGNGITFAGTDRALTNVRIEMSDWAKASDYPGVGDSTGYDQPVTVNLYNVGTGGAVGSLIATRTQTIHVPWHDTGNGYNGTAFTADFDFTGVTVPDSVIYGVAMNTTDHGANPTHVPGPYDSLNYGLTTSEANPGIGTDINPDDTYQNSTWTGAYTDGGAGGLGTFREDSGWTGYTPAIQFSAVPEPGSLALLGLGGLGLLMRRRRRIV